MWFGAKHKLGVCFLGMVSGPFMWNSPTLPSEKNEVSSGASF